MDKLLAWCVGAPKRIRKRARVAARSAAVSAWTAAEAAARKTRKAQVIIARCLTAAALEQSTLVAGAAAAAALAAAAGALLASLTPGSSGSQRRKRKKQREEADWVAWQADAAGEKIRRMYWERDVLPVYSDACRSMKLQGVDDRTLAKMHQRTADIDAVVGATRQADWDAARHAAAAAIAAAVAAAGAERSGAHGWGLPGSSAPIARQAGSGGGSTAPAAATQAPTAKAGCGAGAGTAGGAAGGRAPVSGGCGGSGRSCS